MWNRAISKCHSSTYYFFMKIVSPEIYVLYSKYCQSLLNLMQKCMLIFLYHWKEWKLLKERLKLSLLSICKKANLSLWVSSIATFLKYLYFGDQTNIFSLKNKTDALWSTEGWKCIFDHEACPRRSLECHFSDHSFFFSFSFSYSSFSPSPIPPSLLLLLSHYYWPPGLSL